jgi:alkanesulfonate monooxygenase SsuD/methylene tetrahydromethanopterin reductase-like flavin-dependent oxidoreductase (luciferase family)
MSLGLSIANIGYHHAAWRHPAVPAGGAMDFAHYRHCARLAEEGRFDMIFLADTAAAPGLDSPAKAREREHEHVKHEPLALLAALSTLTTRVGLVPTVSTSYADPFNTARAVGSLDHLSGGRAGWNVVTGFSVEEAQNFGYPSVPSTADRYDRAREFITVMNGLFDSKLRRLDHRGRNFQVRGPLDLPPSPQRHPPIFTAGTSDASEELAACMADVVYAGKPTLEGARTYYASVKSRLARYGRSPDDLRILPGIKTYVGRTRQEAQDKFDQMQALLSPEHGLGLLVASGFPDYTGLDVEGPVPREAAQQKAFYAEFTVATLQKAWRENLTIRQLYELVCAGFWSLGIIGTPADIADLMEEWFTTGAADGFNLQPPCIPFSAEEFVALVIPELQRRDLFRREYEGTTLRDHLGLNPARRT